MTTYIGIDVSKDSLSVAIPKPTTGWKVSSFANSPDGIRSLINQLPEQAHCVLEATAPAARRFLLCFSDLYAYLSQGDDISH
ncbi:hypothetical protein [Spirosoma endophyticum]|uniref:Transposase n=1 Tax=Spirosoma endophyticum TaxID=662367 RepID=A0A1I2ECY1_9BACT|nr:hypothetical protein [Spirosoma endophyticum]SFE90328.1 hypothetical protein SAMN05216167_121105 [Spirosoma endophyticum]